MELVSPKSQILPQKDSFAISVAKTYLGPSEIVSAVTNATAPCSDSLRSYTFNLLPSLASELHTNSSELNVGIRLLKSDHTPIGENEEQIGCVQLLGALMWQNVTVRIGGVQVLPEYTFNPHCVYLKLMVISLSVVLTLTDRHTHELKVALPVTKMCTGP